MYIPPFIAGIIFTIFLEVLIVIIVAICSKPKGGST